MFEQFSFSHYNEIIAIPQIQLNEIKCLIKKTSAKTSKVYQLNKQHK